MGQRANLVLVEDGKQTLYYNHWCANTLDMDLFWGPEYATDFIRIQREVDETGWLDSVWAEGAVVLDHDKKILLFYGGEDTLYEIPLRRVYLRLLARVWQGWDIRWAYEGLADIVDYVSYPRNNVIADREPEVNCSLKAPEKAEWTTTVASVRFADGTLHFYPLQEYIEEYLFCGPALLTENAQSEGVPSLFTDEWGLDFFLPRCGFCVDVQKHLLDYWSVSISSGAPDQIARIWSGWAVNWHRDAFEFQLEAAQGRLRFPAFSQDSLREKVVTELLSYTPARSSADFLRRAAEQVSQDGEAIRLNPSALRDDRLDISLADRQRILSAALDSLPPAADHQP